MAMEKKWFEMTEIRKRRFDSAVWIPLRASQKHEKGKWGYLGHTSEFFGAASMQEFATRGISKRKEKIRRILSMPY